MCVYVCVCVGGGGGRMLVVVGVHEISLPENDS